MKKFLMLSAIVMLLAGPVMAESPNDNKTIVDTAISAGKFNTLVAAAKVAGLVEALSGEGPLTVFAPTDEAFEKLPKGTLESLLRPENKEKLAGILKYHVLAGNYPAAKVLQNDSLKTLQGKSLTITQTDKGVMVDGAKVVATGVMCSNGVVHIIDAVVLPKQ